MRLLLAAALRLSLLAALLADLLLFLQGLLRQLGQPIFFLEELFHVHLFYLLWRDCRCSCLLGRCGSVFLLAYGVRLQLGRKLLSFVIDFLHFGIFTIRGLSSSRRSFLLARHSLAARVLHLLEAALKHILLQFILQSVKFSG